MKYVLSDFIESDMDEIGAYIARDSPRYALDTLRKIRAYFKVIAAGPNHYRLRPEVRPELRMAAVGHYVILFRIVSDVVRIERVLHGMRNIPELLE